VIEFAKEIAEQLRTQDNAITKTPIFIVQQLKKDYGYDPAYSDDIAWIFDGDVEDDCECIEWLEAELYECGEPDGYTRTAYVKRWEFVTACLTRKGCEDYIRANGHNLAGRGHPDCVRIYVESGWRNEEWEELREFFLQAECGA